MSKLLHWDATWPVLRLQGRGARQFLQGQTSADLMAAADGTLLQSCWLTATGRLQALLEIRCDPEGADVLVLSGDAETVAQGFERVIFPADGVRLMPMGHQRRVQLLQSAAEPLWLDLEADLPENLTSSQAADTQALECWRLQQGWPPGPGELTGETNPLELGLADRVSTSKGCYLGQETMAKLIGKAGVKQLLRYWHCDTAVFVGASLRQENERAGSVTSCMATDDGWIGLALVRRQYLDVEILSGPEGQQLQLTQPAAFQDPTD